jgi:heme-degrading monooxygenase HmoA
LLRKKGGESVFVNIIEFPPIKKGKDEEFREWFEWSNSVYASFKGFISRRLLQPTEEGNYVGLVEHESEETFMAMHLSDERQKAWAKVESLLEEKPTPSFYNVVLTSGTK